MLIINAASAGLLPSEAYAEKDPKSRIFVNYQYTTNVFKSQE